MDEVRPGDGPTFCYTWERNRAASREAKVVGSAHSEISEELEVTDGVGAHLEVADCEA